MSFGFIIRRMGQGVFFLADSHHNYMCVNTIIFKNNTSFAPRPWNSIKTILSAEFEDPFV